MKSIKFLLWPFMALFIAFGMASCSDDEPNKQDDPDNPDKPDVPTETVQDYHFDLWVALDRHGGMGRDVQTLVRSVESLEADEPEITFQGEGAEVNWLLSLETIVKGAYYYQVPVAGGRFAKYSIIDNVVTAVGQRPFGINSYATRKYTHAWIDDNTLLIMAADGDATSIIWTKLNTDDMSIISEGTLAIQLPENAVKFTTSGILTYRASDNKLFYFYYGKTAGSAMTSKRTGPMFVAVIDPVTMNIESNDPCFFDCEMTNTAYGELLQTISAVDDDNNLYICCVNDDEEGNEHSHLLKIPAGQTTFDQNYDGFTDGGKLLSVMNIGGNKVVAYARDDQYGTGIDSFSHYYTVIDLSTKTSTPIKYNGQSLPFSSGRFSSRMAYVDGKVYFGVDAEGQKPQIYIYDVQTGETSLGATMAAGYYFEQIRVVENMK